MITKIDNIISLLKDYDGIIIKYRYYDMVTKEMKNHITVNDRTTLHLYAIIDTYTFEQLLDQEVIMFGCEMNPDTNSYILNIN